jgi:hypothetical protein
MLPGLNPGSIYSGSSLLLPYVSCISYRVFLLLFRGFHGLDCLILLSLDWCIVSVINTVALFNVFFQCYMVEIRLRVTTDRVFSVSYKSRV